ncbi:class I SAM-dependent methyltransferase, partial [Bordetella hinzii]|nr:class I SAM-dependent methyltransferase [Bordetella hinzii]
MSTLPEDIAASQRLEQACQALQLSASPDQQEKLLRYMAQMQRWNRTYNLTAIRDPEQMLIQHLFDSLSVVDPLAQSLQGRPAKIYDVGSGGGLPGVVLAIMQPDWDIT